MPLFSQELVPLRNLRRFAGDRFTELSWTYYFCEKVLSCLVVMIAFSSCKQGWCYGQAWLSENFSGG